MSWLCWFNPCKWRWVCNAALHVNKPSQSLSSPIGIYQCQRCKTVSWGKTQ